MSTKKLVTMCLTIRLRDYQAFEDLAEELGVDVFDVKLIEMQPDKKVTEVKKRKRAKPKVKFKVTTELWDKIMSYPESMTYSAIVRQMGKGEKNPRKIPSCQSVSNIRQGKIKRPGDVSVPHAKPKNLNQMSLQ